MPDEQPVINTALDRTNGSLSADELLVGDPLGAVELDAELLAPEGLVSLEVALEPTHLGVALERQYVGGDPVEKPAIVGDDDGAAGEGEERLLQGPQRVDV